MLNRLLWHLFEAYTSIPCQADRSAQPPSADSVTSWVFAKATSSDRVKNTGTLLALSGPLMLTAQLW